MDAQELRNAVSDAARLREKAFDLLREVAQRAADSDASTRALAQELIIRALEHREELGEERAVLEALVRQAGLFPYLDARVLGVADAIAYEAHRPLNFSAGKGAGDADVVFHVAQAAAYRHLLAGEDVVLSAPTSFGKTLIVDALIASGRYENVVMIVPTIALIDENRARLARRFHGRFKVVTHPGQRRAARNVFVMTQERVLELDFEALPRVDLLIVDEFYKLDPKMDPERAGLLNQAFLRMRRIAGQVYLLGPNVKGLSPRIRAGFAPRIISTDYTTVALDVERVTAHSKQEREAALVDLCRRHGGPTLIYCTAPGGCRRVAEALEAAAIGRHRPDLDEAASWIGEHTHPEWVVARLLPLGIGIHHAQMPRWLGQFMVREFNAGRLDFLICTSTLIEGVNTVAKNVVIYENKVGPNALDRFTFNNIKGRAGRMWQHFVGHVFHFFPEPTDELQTVDIPILSQPDDAGEGMLLELKEDERTPGSATRVRFLLDQDLLPESVLRRNAGIPPEHQLRLAAAIADDPAFHHPDLAWSGAPNKQRLHAVCELIWTHLVTGKGRVNGVATADGLAKRLDRLRADPDLRRLIADTLERGFSGTPDSAVESTMVFVRHWIDYDFPKYLRCLDAIQKVVLGRAGLSAGDYVFFAAQVQGHFAGGFLAALSEYGIPLEVAVKLRTALGDPDSLDELLERVGELDVSAVELSSFERTLVTRAIASL
ncbi:MAG: hypothetical protein QOD83_2511 [Solirubrobacteraceae bacterium]|jgi:hypothetical protein|nr:hypothetical protein [Solirubrobacteraceae bacterium]